MCRQVVKVLEFQNLKLRAFWAIPLGCWKMFSHYNLKFNYLTAKALEKWMVGRL